MTTCFVSVESPPSPPVDTPTPATVDHAWSQSPTLRAGHTRCKAAAAATPQAHARVPGRHRLGRDYGRAWQSKWLWLGGLSPPLPGRLFEFLQPAGPRGEGRCPRWVLAPQRAHRPGATSPGALIRGWMGLPEAGSALQGPPGHPLGSQGAAAFQPHGTEPLSWDPRRQRLK